MNPVSRLRKKLGFTMIEVLTALMVMSVVVRIGIPNYQEVRLRAEAAQVAGDFNVVRQAVFEYLAENHSWPPEFGTGQVPPGLTPHLPEGFTFQRGRYQLDWEHLMLPSGLPSHPDARAILGVSIVTEDRALGAALEEILGSTSTHFSLGGSYTFVLETQ
jgi:prepilin-type N-terminal cleavage/methylation domain-containing protein